MQHALLAALAASICSGVIGSLVVINRLGFLTGGIAHAAYGGVGLATLFGLPLLPVTILFSLFSAVLMGWVSRADKGRTDAMVGVIWAAGMALGVVCIDLSPGYQGDLMSFLFGSILTVSRQDLLLIGGLVVLIVLVTYVFFKDLVSLSFEEEYARTRGISVDAIYYLLLGLITVSVVIAIQVVGLILVIALLTIPPHMAEHRARSLPGMMALSMLWSLFFCVAGLMISWWLDLTAGACIIGVATAAYILQQRLVGRR